MMELTFEKLFFESIGKLAKDTCDSVMIYDLDTDDCYMFSKEKTLKAFLEDLNDLSKNFDGTHSYQTTVVSSKIISDDD